MASRIRGRFFTIIFAVVLLGLGFVAGQYRVQLVFQRQLEASYRRALGELADHFQQLSEELARARVAASDKQRGLIGANLRSLAYAAQSNLGQLPLGELNLEGLCGLLADLHEQTYSYVQNAWEPEIMDGLYQQVQYVAGELNGLLLQKQREGSWVSWQRYLSAAVVAPHVLQTFTAINSGLGELRAPLGDRVSVSRGEITGESVDPEQAVEIAREFCGREGLHFQVTNESKGQIPTYTVEAKDEKGQIIVEVSQKGGMVLWMMDSQEINSRRFSTEELVEKGREFLTQRGFPELHLTDVQVLRNRATLTFVPSRDGVLRYGETVKVQVSAADGTIVGFWGTPFFTAQSRLESSTQLQATWDVRDKLRAGLEVLDEKLALIPGPGEGEVLTRRVGVRYQDEYYLIYLNAETGEEEQIVHVSSPQYF